MTEDVVPGRLLDFLPFSSEAFSQWGDETDLHRFLRSLYDQELTVIDPDGNCSTANMQSFGSELFQSGQETVAVWIHRFTHPEVQANARRNDYGQTIDAPDLSDDTTFGRAAKCLIAWDSVAGAILEESAFYSIAHVLESGEDLTCSLHLAANLYYKQSLQILRNFIEDLVLPVHFCSNPEEFAAWKVSNYHIPPLRGRSGVLRRLVDQQVIDSRIANEISTLYDELNGCVHGSVRRLTHGGAFTGELTDRAFKYEELWEWCNYFSRSVEIGIVLLRAHLTQWEHIVTPLRESLRLHGLVLCDVCHNDSEFDTEQLAHAGGLLMVFRCCRCGSQTIVRDAPSQS